MSDSKWPLADQLLLRLSGVAAVTHTKTKAEIIHMLQHDLNGELSTGNLLFEMLEQWTGYDTLPVDKKFVLLTQTRHIVTTAKAQGRL